MTDRFSIEGRTVVIIGGKGVYGDRLTEAFAREGAHVYACARDIDTLRQKVSGLQAEGLNVTAVCADQSDEDSLTAFRNLVLSHEEKIDIAVLNAVARPVKSWHCDKADFEKSMSVNATGTFLATRCLGDVMAASGGGSIILIGSMQGMIGPDAQLYEGLNMNGYIPDYFFHKGGLINFARFAASYYGPNNVRVNCVSPGGCRSEHNSPEFAQRYAKRTFLGRMANPDDLVGTVIFLAGDASAYITGANIPVDGGYTAK